MLIESIYSNNSSFFTNRNFQTQLGREIVYEIETQTNPKFKNLTEEILKKNIYTNIWQWQNYSFSENMLKTMNDLIPAIEKIKFEANSNKFNFLMQLGGWEGISKIIPVALFLDLLVNFFLFNSWGFGRGK